MSFFNALCYNSLWNFLFQSLVCLGHKLNKISSHGLRACFIFLILFFFSISAGGALKKPTVSLAKEWESALISLLDSGVLLQKAFYAQADRQVSLSSTKMTYQISQLQGSSYFLPYHQRFYIQNLLKNLGPPLESLLTQKRGGEESIKFISRTLTYLAQIYGLNQTARKPVSFEKGTALGVFSSYGIDKKHETSSKTSIKKYAVFFCHSDRSVYLQESQPKIKKVSYPLSLPRLYSADCEQITRGSRAKPTLRGTTDHHRQNSLLNDS